MSKPNAITVSQSKRGTTVKATGAAAQALFDALTTKVDPRLAAQRIGPCTVHFEDHGQDFLEWDLDEHGQVVACRPFQALVWCGKRVMAPPVVGQKLHLRRPDGSETLINYPVAKVVRQVADATG